MPMFTRCPHCRAAFRVKLEQLQVSSGRVRCGVCGQIFDAFTSLSASDPRGASAAPGREATQSAPGLPGTPSGHAAGPEDAIGRDRAAPESPGLDVRPAAGSRPAAEPSQGGPAWRPAPPAYSAVPMATDDQPAGPDQGTPGGRDRRRAARLVLAFLLALALVVQGAHFLRGRLSAWAPGVRPLFEAACRTLGCDVPLPKLADRLSIETSDLQALDPARPNRVVLVATIRNRARVAQAYPMVELTLTGAREQAVARRVFAPAEYFGEPIPSGGLAPGAEVNIRLRLDTTVVRANGYRLYLFHP